MLSENCYRIFVMYYSVFISSEYQVVDYVVVQVTRFMFIQLVTCISYMQNFITVILVIITYCYHSKEVYVVIYRCSVIVLQFVTIGDMLHGKCYSSRSSITLVSDTYIGIHIKKL